MQKKNIKTINIWGPLFFAILYTVIGILLVRNEVFCDDWYIESSADGFFGLHTRSFFTLGSNYIFLFLIYLLSLTRIRLSWIHVLMVIMNAVSMFMVEEIVFTRIKGKLKYLVSGMLVVAVLPFTMFYIQFTTTAVFTVAAGTLKLYMEQSKKLDRNVKAIIFSVCWILFGAALRFDAIYYSILFFGCLGLVNIFIYLKKEKKDKFIQAWLYVRPFFITLILLFVMEGSQRVLMNHMCPGFKEWNDVRTQVDDCEIPEYDAYQEEYQMLGMDYNDYLLLKSWNNQDENFFDTEKYNRVLELKADQKIENDEEINVIKGIAGSVVYAFSLLASNYSVWICIMFILIIIFYGKLHSYIKTGSILVVASCLELYFSYIGRRVWRTEWPIFLVGILAFLAVMSEEYQENNEKKSKIFSIIIIAFSSLSIFFPVYKNSSDGQLYTGKSMANLYSQKILSEDTYGKFVYKKITKKDIPYYATSDYELQEYTQNHKKLIFYHLWMSDWKQINPLPNKDLFRTADIGAGENWSTLGQYLCKLPVLKNVESKYGIKNRFQDLIFDNVRVVSQNHEMYLRTKEITNYLKDHYYSAVDYSVTKRLTNTTVGCFIANDKIEYDKDYETIEGDMDSFIFSEDANMRILQFHLNKKFENKDILVQFKSNNDIHNFYVMVDDGGQLYAMVYNDALKENEAYEVKLIVGDTTQKKVYAFNKKITIR